MNYCTQLYMGVVTPNWGSHVCVSNKQTNKKKSRILFRKAQYTFIFISFFGAVTFTQAGLSWKHPSLLSFYPNLFPHPIVKCHCFGNILTPQTTLPIPYTLVRTRNYLAATMQLIGAVFQGMAGEEVVVGSSYELRGLPFPSTSYF